jgi:lipoyl(octanoyl) transferase
VREASTNVCVPPVAGVGSPEAMVGNPPADGGSVGSVVGRAARTKAAGDGPTPLIRRLGLVEYEPTWRAMQRFTDERDATTPDEIWFLEHPQVFTLGMNASREHVLAPGDIPVVQIDRGGQVTYHGPGQLVVYPLIDLRRAGLGVRDLVTALERSVIGLAAEYGVVAEARRNAPGVYVEGRKLASVGIRIRRGASYHGLAMNVSLDLEPFGRINPCGYQGLQMTQLADIGGPASVGAAAEALEPHLLKALGFLG